MLLKIVCTGFFIAFLQGVTDVSGRRCSEMLKDEPCVIDGVAPLTLQCDRKTGMFFKIKSLSVEYSPEVWTEVSETKASAACRDSRGLDINQEYFCVITEKDLCPFADRMRNVKISYYCWELDPELLQGFIPQGESPGPDGFGWSK